jgi:adenylate cyclase
VGGEKRRITVIFTDIRSFTSISEKLQPQSLVSLLNEYFAVMAEVIIRNGGPIDKFEGDAIMALFGAVGNQPNHARQACQAALEMRSALPRLLEKWRKDSPLPGGEKKPYENFDFRVGVSTGEAIVGNIGADGKIEFTAIGDIVNLGSRLEGANKLYGTNVMVSEETFEQTKDSFECRFMDVIRVKGKQQPIKIYQLLCPRGGLQQEQIELLEIYNRGVQLYFESKFVDALKVFQEDVLKRWPNDHLAEIYAGRCELLKRYPPSANWDFVYTMKSK